MPTKGSLTNVFIAMWLLVSAPAQLWATPGFELDLKELKSPSSPPPAATKKNTSGKTVTKKIQPARQPTQVTKKPKTAPPQQVPPAAPVLAVAPSELALKGGDACQLAERMAVSVARSVPSETLLNGLDLKPVAAVRAAGLSALITCGIPPAEAYTFARLLEAHEIQLLNINGTETISQVGHSINDTLALSYLIEKDATDQGGELIYLYPADTERQRPLRLILQP